jgi:hypothetical protein
MVVEFALNTQKRVLGGPLACVAHSLVKYVNVTGGYLAQGGISSRASSNTA